MYDLYETYKIMPDKDQMPDAILEMDVSEARERFADAVNIVAYGGRRIILRKHGRRAVALVSLADIERLEELEDRFEGQRAEEARAEPERIPVAEVRRLRTKRRPRKR